MRFVFKEFYRQKGIRYDASLVQMPEVLFDGLPKNSLFHYVPTDVEHTGVASIDTSLTIFQGYAKKILYETITDYVDGQGPFRKLVLDIKQDQREWRIKNRQMWIASESAWLKERSPEVLLVLNYGYLDRVHRYIPNQLMAYYRWENRQRTVWSTVARIAKESDRHQFLIYPVPGILQGKTLLDKYSPLSVNVQLLKIFGQEGAAGFMHLDMWRWLSVVHRAKSLMQVLPVEHYRRINLVFIGKTGRPAILNLGYLNSWIKGQPNQTDFGSVIQHEPLFMQKLYLKFCMNLNGFDEEKVSAEGEVAIQAAAASDNDPVKLDRQAVQSDPEEEAKLLLEDQEEAKSLLNEEPDEVGAVDAMQQLSVNKDMPVPAPAPAAEAMTKSLDRQLLEDIEADIEALDRISLIQTKNVGVKLADTTPEAPELPTIDPHAVRAKVYGSKQPSDQLKSLIAEQAEANLITASKYRKMEQAIGQYQKSTDPYGSHQSRLKAMEIKPEEIVITDEEAKIIVSEATPDQTMAASTLRKLDQKYISQVMRKDVLHAVDSLQNAGVIIRRHEIDVTHSVLGGVERHTLELEPIDGQPSTIRFSLPVVNEEGKFLANGNWYAMRRQRVDLPIRKIAPQIVGLTTYYGKTFVQVSDKLSNNSLLWLYRQINNAITQSGTYIHQVTPGNVFDNDLKAPYIYNAIAKEYESFAVGTYQLNFNYRVRQKQVNPELLKIIERKGRVWCGWSKEKHPIVVDPKNHFYQISKDGEVDLGDVYAFFQLPVQKAPIDFSEVRIFSKYIPVGIVLGYYLGFQALVALLGIDYRLVPARKNRQLQDDEFAIIFEDGSYVFKRTDPAASLVMAGFLEFEMQTKQYPVEQFENKDVYLNLLSSKKLGAIYIRELDMMEHCFVDPISMEILEGMKEPTTFKGLMVRATQMLTTYDHPVTQDRSAMRDRGYERFAGAVYKTVMQSIRRYRNMNVSGRSKVDMSPFEVWNALMKDSSMKIVEDINPIQNLKESEIVTYSGVGGREKDSMTKPMRASHRSAVGVDSESTVDSTAVGTIMYLSANPNIKDVRGMLREDKELNPTRMLSTAALASPFSGNDN